MNRKIIFYGFIFAFILTSKSIINGKDMRPEIISLPPASGKGKMSLEETINKRKSVRDFAAKKLTLEQISQLLWAAYGQKVDAITGASKTVPSAGAMYPMEILALTSDGLYRYLSQEHCLEILSKKDLRKELQYAALGQDCIYQAPLDIVIACVYERICQRYHERGIQYAHYEAGHIAQNIHLQAVSLGLGSVPIGAFYEDKVRALLSLPKDWVVLYIIPVGYPK